MWKISRAGPLALALVFSLLPAAPAAAQSAAAGGTARAAREGTARTTQQGAARDGTARAPQLGSPLSPGATEWSVFYTYGINQRINASAGDIDIATGGVRWSRLWGENFGGFLRGHPAVAIEVLPLFAFLNGSDTTWAYGANLLYEHHFVGNGRILPVWRLGAGIVYANREIPAGETRFNFSVLTGLGVDILLGERRTLFVGYRFHHVSNANTGSINPGVNAHSFVFGLSIFR